MACVASRLTDGGLCTLVCWISHQPQLGAWEVPELIHKATQLTQTARATCQLLALHQWATHIMNPAACTQATNPCLIIIGRYQAIGQATELVQLLPLH